jgi:hypothetical protein
MRAFDMYKCTHLVLLIMSERLNTLLFNSCVTDGLHIKTYVLIYNFLNLTGFMVFLRLSHEIMGCLISVFCRFRYDLPSSRILRSRVTDVSVQLGRIFECPTVLLAWTLKMRSIDIPGISLTNYQHVLRQIPQERVTQGYMIPDGSG